MYRKQTIKNENYRNNALYLRVNGLAAKYQLRVYIFFLRATRGAQTILGDTFLVCSGDFGKICPYSWDAFVLPTSAR